MEPVPKVGEVGDQVAARLRQWREEKKLTTRELAERTVTAGRPIHASGIVKIEARARRIDVDDLAVLAAALGVKPAQLLTGDIDDFGSLRNRWVSEQKEALGPLADAYRKARSAGIATQRLVGYLNFLNNLEVADFLAEHMDDEEEEEEEDGEH